MPLCGGRRRSASTASRSSAFLEALRAADVRQLLDVRQRRGVRGSEYAWANAARLQAALARGRDRVPPPQGARAHDRAAPAPVPRGRRGSGVGKRSRAELAPAYVERYTAEILDKVDLAPIVEAMPADGVAALFCVERDPEACHRSLIAERLATRHGLPLTHLLP